MLTGADGRTTRLSPDGKKIKDENTKIERKTKWDGGKLVSEINGLGSRQDDADVRASIRNASNCGSDRRDGRRPFAASRAR